MKISKFVQSGRLLAATTAAVVALPAVAASNGLCGPNSCTVIANQNELFYRTTETGEGAWFQGLDVISSIGGTGWQPIAGDFDNDGDDDLAAYKDGVFAVDWNINGRFGAGITTYTLPTSAGWGANTIPITGDWDGDGADDLAIYTNGMFRLFPDHSDLTDQISISFGNLPQIPGYIFTQMPFSGPIDNLATHRVGVYFGDYALYAAQTVDGQYSFTDRRTTNGVIGYSPRPGLYSRPHILTQGSGDSQFSFIMPPDLPPIDPSICDEERYTCLGIFEDRPDTEQPVVIVPDPFQ